MVNHWCIIGIARPNLGASPSVQHCLTTQHKSLWMEPHTILSLSCSFTNEKPTQNTCDSGGPCALFKTTISAIERQHQTVIIGPANAVIMQRLWCHNMASVLCVHQAHQGPPNPSQGALVADKSCRHSPSVHACYCFLATVLGRHKRAFLKAFFPEFRTWLPTKPSVVRLFKYCNHLLRHRFFVTILSKVPKKTL